MGKSNNKVNIEVKIIVIKSLFNSVNPSNQFIILLRLYKKLVDVYFDGE